MRTKPSVALLVVLITAALLTVFGCFSEDPRSPEIVAVDQPNPASQRPVIDGTNFSLEDKLEAKKSLGPAATASLSTTDLTVLTPADLVNELLGAGPSAPIVSNITYIGADIAAGTFTGGAGIIGFNSGIILSSGNIASVPGPNMYDDVTTDNGLAGDPDLDDLIPGFETFDATVLEFDFECTDLLVVSFQYVFSSDEYNEFVNTDFNDVFGFFLNGNNIALLPDNVTPVSINNVNCDNPFNPPNGSNCGFYRNNDLSDGGGGVDTEMDGLTMVFSATATLNPGINHIKLSIADAGDRILDSNVFIKGESFVCEPPPDDCCEKPDLKLLGYRTVSYVPPLWTVQVKMANGGPCDAHGVTAVMNENIPWLTVPDASCAYGTIANVASSWGDPDSYTFDLTGWTGGSFNIFFDVSTNDECGNQYFVRLDPGFDPETESEMNPDKDHDLRQE